MSIDGAAIDRIKELAQEAQAADAKVLEVAGVPLSTIKLHDARTRESEPEPLVVHSLKGFADYLEANADELDPGLMVHVVGPRRVDLLSPLTGEFRQRFTYARAEVVADAFAFGAWLGHEEFVIALQSRFTDEGDRADVLKVVGNLKDEAVRTHADDGVTQQVTAKGGVSLVEEVEVPNPVQLFPFRTFPEVAQPGSEFVLRVRKGQHGPEVALFEADGGAWRVDAIERIATWLSTQIDVDVTLLS